jgi:hypothetical protein
VVQSPSVLSLDSGGDSRVSGEEDCVFSPAELPHLKLQPSRSPQEGQVGTAQAMTLRLAWTQRASSSSAYACGFPPLAPTEGTGPASESTVSAQLLFLA